MSESDISHVSNSDSEDEKLLREQEMDTCTSHHVNVISGACAHDMRSHIKQVYNFEEPDGEEFLNLDTLAVGKYMICSKIIIFQFYNCKFKYTC